VASNDSNKPFHLQHHQPTGSEALKDLERKKFFISKFDWFYRDFIFVFDRVLVAHQKRILFTH
jgi:hypothetical protein